MNRRPEKYLNKKRTKSADPGSSLEGAEGFFIWKTREKTKQNQKTWRNVDNWLVKAPTLTARRLKDDHVTLLTIGRWRQSASESLTQPLPTDSPSHFYFNCRHTLAIKKEFNCWLIWICKLVSPRKCRVFIQIFFLGTRFWIFSN